MRFAITSGAFRDGGMIPAQYTCDGKDVSPPLKWDGAPEKTRSFALICDDPDAPRGTWVHWVVFNIPGDVRGLPEGITGGEKLANGASQGINDFGKTGYGGPCPPGGTHRYYFKLYALDSTLDVHGKVSKEALLRAMQGKITAEAALIGKYGRR